MNTTTKTPVKPLVKKLLSDRVLILPDPQETITHHGIIIPKDAQQAPTMGTVMQVGLGKRGAHMVLKEGDRVIFPYMAGSDVELGEDKVIYKNIRETDIFAVILPKKEVKK